MVNNDSSNLVEAWDVVESTSRKAIEWTKNSENNSVPLVKNTASSAQLKLLHKIANARMMKQACKNRSGIGLFGESQAGKSYLVSTLASDGDNRLMTILGDTEFDFIKQINPQGGGKESTGLVTRFSSKLANPSDNDYPVQLQLIKECEIAKILINSYFNDFKNVSTFDSSDISNILDIGTKVSRNSTKSISEDEILSLQDYVANNYPNLYKQLGEGYWKIGVSHIIYASIEDRADFYSCLWNGQSAFKTLFIQLAKVLATIQSETVYAQIESIVPTNNEQQPIIDVDALRCLSNPRESGTIRIKTPSKVIDVTVAELAALTAELFISVKNNKSGVLDKMDLLDFPGYRGRLQINHIDDSDKSDATGRSLLSELFLRGKVAYLFEKYTENRGVNCLIVCCSAETQINSNIENVITRWIDKTQGNTPEKRSEHQPGLFWAITKFDTRIGTDLNKGSEQLKYGSDGLLQQTILEKFGRCEWFTNWSGTDENPIPFNNIFLVRKPGLLNCAFIENESKQAGSCDEKAIKSEFKKNLDMMKSKFVREPTVKKYIKDPSAAWDAVLELNDGGMTRLCRAIDEVDAASIRYKAFVNDLQEECEDGINILSQWYTSSDKTKSLEQHKKNWQDIRLCFRDEKKTFYEKFGDFLKIITIPEYKIKETYYVDDSKYIDEDQEPVVVSKEFQSIQNQENIEQTDSSSVGNDGWVDFSFVNKDDLEVENGPAEENHIAINTIKNIPFGQRIYLRWIDYLRNITSNINDFERMNVPKNVINKISIELVSYIERSNIEQLLIESTSEVDKLANSKENAYPIMESVVENIISEFVHSLGNTVLYTDGTEHFIEGTTIPKLPEDESKETPGRKFVYEWMNCFCQIIKENANFATDTGISTVQNNLLGEYILSYKKCGKV